jgi:hypothetical protein
MPQKYFQYPHLAVNEFIRQLNEQLSAQMKILLEEKHLYQKFTFDPNAIKTEILKGVVGDYREEVEENIDAAIGGTLLLVAGSGISRIPRGEDPEIIPCLFLPNARLFCTACNERNAFKPVWSQDATNELLTRSAHGTQPGLGFDVAVNRLYFVAYQCQHCESAPIGFLVRREGWRFSLDGRSPMEEIQVPGYIPKREAHLYRDAMISWIAGKKLAAVFYLRAFIEQFARRQTGMKGRETGDEIMAEYSSTLPANQRDQMPSLREWYGKLSMPIHSADEAVAEALFEAAREEIERHFDIRRVFKIAES